MWELDVVSELLDEPELDSVREAVREWLWDLDDDADGVGVGVEEPLDDGVRL